MNTILFDLDGTLLPLDMEEFTQAYFTQLANKLSDHINPKELPKLIWASTKYMISDTNPDKTNKEAFFEDFKTRINNDIELLNPILDEFYNKDFKQLKDVVYPSDLSKKIIDKLKTKNFDLVIATNPLFPKEAIYHRIQWAGLDKDDFRLITTYEEMHYCKPNPKYYQEILQKIDKTSDEVMMVGNDEYEDMIASKLGIKTYLIEDYKIDRENNRIEPDYRGNLKDFYEFIKEL